LQTDSSYRFERGTDRDRLTVALDRTAQLIQEVAGGAVARGILDIQGPPAERRPVILSIERANRLLGIELAGTQIADYLVNLGFEIRSGGTNALVVTAPSHRVDVSRDVDLIEEVARLHNYNKIPTTMPRVAVLAPSPSPLENLIENARDELAALGLGETMHYTFTSEARAEALGFDPAGQPHLSNPLTADQAIMRPTILSGMLDTVALAQNQGEPSVAIFEVGKVWPAGSAAGDPDAEGWEAGLALAGPAPAHWSAEARDYDFYDLKGVVETLLGRWGEDGVIFERLAETPLFHPGVSARVVWRGRPVGELGELHPDLVASLDLRGRVFVGRMDLKAIEEACRGREASIRPIPRFPASQRDLAVVVERALPAGEIVAAAREAGGELVERIEVFDVYEGEHVEADKKSIALSLRLRSSERTLTEEEIKKAVDRVVACLAEKFSASLRT
jgi:phenylalanyl-tRNA synthetase beta chain